LGLAAVVKVVAVLVIDVNVIKSVPICGPVFRPRIYHQERKAAVLETRIAQVHRGAADAEEVLAAERDREAILRNVVTPIAAALRPGAMLGLPAVGLILLPSVMPLEAAALL
jgi:hypothetical protein